MTEEEVLTKNRGLVFQSCIKFKAPAYKAGLDMEDIESVGMIGLLLAHRRFDESRKLRFSTYAYHYIAGEIQKAIVCSTRGIYYSHDVRQKAVTIEKRGLTEMEPEQIAEELGISESVAFYALKFLHSKIPKPLHTPVNKSKSNPLMLSDVIGGDMDLTTIIVKDFEEMLTDREKVILKMKLAGLTNTDIGKRMGVTKSAVGLWMKPIKEKAAEYFGVNHMNNEKEAHR